MKFKIYSVCICFLILYGIAFVSNIGYRENDDILWVSRSQWQAIILFVITMCNRFY